MKKVFWAVGFLGLLVCVFAMTWAQSLNTVMAVQANVPGGETVSVIPLVFGDLLQDYKTLGTSVITVKIPSGTQYYIALDIGQNDGGSNERRLKHKDLGEYIAYDIFQDGVQTTRWGDAGYGDTVPNGAPMGPLTGTGAEQQYTVYGIAGEYTAAHTPGVYFDNVTITVYY